MLLSTRPPHGLTATAGRGAWAGQRGRAAAYRGTVEAVAVDAEAWE